MIIAKFLPNPGGKDSYGEFIELFNDAASQTNLSGWKIKDASGKTFIFKNQTIEAGGYLTLNYKTTKITLNNDAETLFLYDAGGNLVDKAEFSGTAQEGKSFARENNQFVLTSKPTPGEPNIFEIPTNSLATTKIIPNNSATIINASVNLSGLFIGFFIAIILASLFVFISKRINLSSD